MSFSSPSISLGNVAAIGELTQNESPLPAVLQFPRLSPLDFPPWYHDFEMLKSSWVWLPSLTGIRSSSCWRHFSSRWKERAKALHYLFIRNVEKLNELEVRSVHVLYEATPAIKTLSSNFPLFFSPRSFPYSPPRLTQWCGRRLCLRLHKIIQREMNKCGTPVMERWLQVHGTTPWNQNRNWLLIPPWLKPRDRGLSAARVFSLSGDCFANRISASLVQ